MPPAYDVVRVPRRVFQRLLPERPTPERCVEAYYLQPSRFESIAERKLRGRQLTQDGMSRSAGGTRAECQMRAVPRSPNRPKAAVRPRLLGVDAARPRTCTGL